MNLRRFIAANPADQTRSGNLVPGLVVDTHITSPILFDYYMISHEGIQVTSQFLDLANVFKGTPGYKSKLLLIGCQWSVKTNGATFIFVGKLGNTFLPG